LTSRNKRLVGPRSTPPERGPFVESHGGANIDRGKVPR
jgi:hypothetical protein